MLFEVPYNFDENLIKFYKKNRSYINYLYLPPYKDDSANTRTSIQTNTVGHCYMPNTREEYEYHLRRIKEAGLRFVILWQVYEHDLSIEMLDYYSGLETSGFIVANDKNAALIKQYNPQLLVICSIVQRTCYNILNKDLTNYDYVILYYTFNRALDVLKLLSNLKDKLIIMPNTLCDVNCPSVHHWFPTKDKPFDPSRDCSMTIEHIDRCGFIFPEHLKLFDKYVGGYKLQGRELATESIKYLCHFYFKRTEYEDFVMPFLREDMAEKLKKMFEKYSVEEYYNTKTAQVIKIMENKEKSLHYQSL